MVPSSKCCRVQACPLQYRIPPQLAPTQLQQQKQNTAKPQIVGYTMQMLVHSAPFASVAFRTSVLKFFEDHPRMYCPSRRQLQWRGKHPKGAKFASKRSKFPLRLSLTVHMPYSYLGYVRLPLQLTYQAEST